MAIGSDSVGTCFCILNNNKFEVCVKHFFQEKKAFCSSFFVVTLLHLVWSKLSHGMKFENDHFWRLCNLTSSICHLISHLIYTGRLLRNSGTSKKNYRIRSLFIKHWWFSTSYSYNFVKVIYIFSILHWILL